jgi:hypothetical protein
LLCRAHLVNLDRRAVSGEGGSDALLEVQFGQRE